MRLTLTLLLGLLLVPAGLRAQAQSCRDEETIRQCFVRSASEIAGSHDSALAEAPAAVLNRQSTGIGALGPGLASAISDFLPTIAGALGLTQTTTEEGGTALETNLRLPVGAAPQKVQLRLLLLKPTLFQPLRDSLTAAARDTRIDALERELDDFDDVQLSVAWNLENRTFGRTFEPVRPLAGRLFELQRESLSRDPEVIAARARSNNFRQQATPVDSAAMDAAKLNTKIGDRECKWNRLTAQQEIPVGCFTVEARGRMETALLQDAREAVRVATKLDSVLTSSGFYQLGLLVNNQPQLSIQGTATLARDLVGPDGFEATVRYEAGFANINALRSFARTRCKATEDLSITPDCFRRFLSSPATASDLKHGDRFFVEGRIARRSEYRIARSDEGLNFTINGTWDVTGGAGYGRYVSFNQQGEGVGRVDLSAEYIHHDDDPTRESRFVAAGTFTYRVSEGLSLAAGLAYASKPEFLGDVDKKFSANFGLRYKINRT